MTTAVIAILAACLAFLFGWIRGFLSAVRLQQAVQVEEESDDFVLTQRENAEWQ